MKRLGRVSATDFGVAFLAAAVVAFVNFAERDIGSGLHVHVQGWPFPSATQHAIHGTTFHWLGLAANLVTGMLVIMVVAMMHRRLTGWLAPRDVDSEQGNA